MRDKLLHYLNKTIVICSNILFVLFFLQIFIVDVGVVNGQSMEPRMKDEQIFLINRTLYLATQPSRGDIVQFFNPDESGTYLVKRVVGLPGEIINIKRGRIYIKPVDGEEYLLDEPYIEQGILTSVKPNLPTEISVPEHSYYVVGDNRIFSGDSREYGPIHRQFITGKVISY